MKIHFTIDGVDATVLRHIQVAAGAPHQFAQIFIVAEDLEMYFSLRAAIDLARLAKFLLAIYFVTGKDPRVEFR